MKSFWYVGLMMSILVVLVIHFFGLLDWLTLFYVQGVAHTLFAWAKMHVVLAPLFYMGIIVLSTALFSPITLLATIVGGYLFGVLAGLCYTIVAFTLGSCMVVLLVRDGLGPFFRDNYRRHAAAFNNELEQYGAYYVLMINFLPMTPTVIINIIVGLSSLSIWSFAWATALGVFPDTLIYILVGEKLLTITSLNDLFSWQIISLLTLFVIFILISMFLSRWLRIKKITVPVGKV